MSILKKIILLLFLVSTIYTGDWGFKLPELKLKPESNSDQRLWIGDNWIKDSTNYFVFNQGGYFWDSLRVRRNLYVGELGGTIYLDTNQEFYISSGGYDILIANTKFYGGLHLYVGRGESGAYYWYKLQSSTTWILMHLDSASGLTVDRGNIQLTGGTQQILFPSDTASDYDWNDSITINKQSGIVTTDTLLTAAGEPYTLIIQNSLVSTTSKVLMTMNGDNTSSGIAMFINAVPLTGVIYVVIRNIHASDALNSWVKLSFLVVN